MDFGTVFTEHYVYIYNFALKLSCHPQDAEDLTQQTFMAAVPGTDEPRRLLCRPLQSFGHEEPLQLRGVDCVQGIARRESGADENGADAARLHGERLSL